MAQDERREADNADERARSPEADRRQRLTQLVLCRTKLSASEALVLQGGVPRDRRRAPRRGLELARRLVDQLSPEHQRVVEAVILNGLSQRDAAAVLDLPEGTVKSRVIAAKRELLALAERALATEPERRHMNDAESWIYFDGPEPEHLKPLLDALRDLPPAMREDKERAIRRFLERLDATSSRGQAPAGGEEREEEGSGPAGEIPTSGR